MYITRLQLNIGSGLSDSIIDGCFTTTCGGLLRLRLGWKIILVVVAIVGIVSIRIVVKVILICWKIRGFSDSKSQELVLLLDVAAYLGGVYHLVHQEKVLHIDLCLVLIGISIIVNFNIFIYSFFFSIIALSLSMNLLEMSLLDFLSR